MPKPKIQQLFDAIWSIDRADGVAGLMKLTTF
jgi:hypothetical protein